MPKTSRAGVERLKTPPPTGRRRAEESPSASLARSRSSRAHTQRLLELECLENVLHRSCGKENRARAYLRRALNVESDGQERIFCFDGPDEHIRRALLAQRPAWVENQMAHSKIFHLKWTVSDCEQDYCHLQEGTLFNHFQKNRELTTKVGLLTNLRRFAGEEQVDVDAFFPRSYDMSSAGDVADFVLDFRRSAALNVLRQHLRLARWHRERRRLLEVVHLEAPFDGSSYVCNLNVLRLALQAVRHWLQDLDPDFLEDEGRRSWRPLDADEWDAVVLYAELSEAALCGEDEEHRKRLRGYTASGVSQKGSGRERQCSENHRLWPEFLEHHWGEASESLCKEAMEAVEALEAQWPQATLTGPMNVWVAKPGSASKGSGVICLDSLPELLHHCKVTANRIVQKYIERPLLLFSGRKFDLRQWVLVRSFQPLKVYMFSSCYLRLCNEPYDLGDLQNRQRHISNWSVNKRGRHVSDGAVASLQDFQKVLQMITGHSRYWEDQLVPQLKRSILHSLRAVQSSVVQRFESFEIFGFDFILGEDLKPWLLEVNLSPACESRTAWMSEMLERMASRVVELLLQGRLEADGLEPDWVCIADEEGLDGEERKEENPKLSVVGKALSKRFSRRLDHIWRRNEAQICLARCFRGFAARRRLCAARRRAARRWLRGLRARLWCQLVRQAGAWQCRPAAARALQGACHGFAAQRLLCAARWRAGALALQRLWRGHRARGWACQLRRQRAAIRLQRWSRSSRFLRVLRAKRRLLRWWRRVFSLRARAAVRIQAMLRQSMAVRRCRRLRQHAQGARRVELVFSVIRWRRWIALSRATAACCRLQRCWRGFRGRSQAQCRRRLREAFRSWQETGCHVRRCALRLQRAWRRLQCRRLWRRRVSLLRRLQRHWRRWRTVQGARREAAAVRLQRSVRDFLGRLAVKLARRRILAIQLAMRACIAKRRLQKLRRFEERRKRWLKQIPKEQARSTEQTDLLKRLEWQNAKAQEVQLDEDATTRSASSTRTAGEIEVYIDPVESRPQQEQEASGQSDEDVWVLPLLERLQDAAKCFDLAAGRSEGRPSTGSALRAARELRQRPGESYSKPTMSSARRNAEKGGNEVADLNALLLRKATPKSKPRRGSLKPWRLTE